LLRSTPEKEITMATELAELLVADAAAWRAWLAEHHATGAGVRLVLRRGQGEVTTLTHAEALDEALCFGWIDGQGAKRDEATWTVRFTPRRGKSNWSARNVGIVGRLERAGRMHESGRAAVRAAQADGRWERNTATAGGTVRRDGEPG
jgi:uncharacterized protein YdeI (YjbR/CyaY-like superfamily)